MVGRISNWFRSQDKQCHSHTYAKEVWCFITRIMQLSQERKAGIQACLKCFKPEGQWLWLFLQSECEVGWGFQCMGREPCLNLTLLPKDRAAGLSYRVVPMWNKRDQRCQLIKHQNGVRLLIRKNLTPSLPSYGTLGPKISLLTI